VRYEHHKEKRRIKLI
jgi:hypothetical protein